MRHQIDWISFTLPIVNDSSTEESLNLAFEQAFLGGLGDEVGTHLAATRWTENEHGRAPYSASWSIADNGITVFWGEKRKEILVEISGKGCDYIRSVGLESKLLERVQGRLSRLDIATDIESDTKPSTFVAERTGRKASSIAHMESVTGETVYVGSRSSEQYARVYRYKEPHPRAALLRVECVFRRKYARTIASEILVQGLVSVVGVIGSRYGWAHSDWRVSADDSDIIKFPRPEREAGGTVFWLIKQAAPAFQRLVREGVIENPAQFLEQYFLTDVS